jgi:hypothetical protein
VDRGAAQVVVRGWVTLAATVVAALVVVAPLLGASPLAASDLLILSLAALAAVGAIGVVCWQLAVPPRSGVGSPVRVADVPVLRGRATDPVHHPLAPRAPGQA